MILPPAPNTPSLGTAPKNDFSGSLSTQIQKPITIPFDIAPAVASAKPATIPFDAAPAVPKDSTKPFKYDVPETTAQKVARLNAENEPYKAAAAKANSFTERYIRPVADALLPGVASLGDTVSGIINTKTETAPFDKQMSDLNTIQLHLIEQINNRNKAGEDTTQLKQLYNQNVEAQERAKAKYQLDTAAVHKTTGQVAGELASTALNLATAGTYGKATAEMKSGELAVRGPISALAARTGIPATNTLAKDTIPTAARSAKTLLESKAGLFTKQGIKNVIKGGVKAAPIAYSYDVTQGLMGNRGKDRMGGKSFIPGQITATGIGIGAGIPTLVGAENSVKNGVNKFVNRNNPEVLAAKRTTELNKVTDSYQKLKKITSQAKERGYDPATDIAKTNLLDNSIDKDGKIRTTQAGGAVEQYNEFIQPKEAVVGKLLEKEGKTIPLKEVERQLNKAIDESGVKGGAKIRAFNNVADDIAGYKLDMNKDGSIPLKIIHDAKVDKYSNINYTNPESSKVDKIIARTLKQIVEKNTTSADVKAVNDELARHFTNINYLEKLDGTGVAGSKLGKYFAKTVGAIVGSHFGPLGSIVGSEVAGKIKGASMEATFGKPGLGKALEDSALMKDAVKKANMPKPEPLQLPAPEPGTPGSINNVPINLGGATIFEPAAENIRTSSFNPKTGISYVKDLKTGKTTIIPKAGAGMAGFDTISQVASRLAQTENPEKFYGTTDIYSKSGALKPEVAIGFIDDAVNKLNKFRSGLGDQFRKTVDVNSIFLDAKKLPSDLIEKAKTFLTKK